MLLSLDGHFLTLNGMPLALGDWSNVGVSGEWIASGAPNGNWTGIAVSGFWNGQPGAAGAWDNSNPPAGAWEIGNA